MSVWFPAVPNVPSADVTLLCLPPGGGDVSSFRYWQRGLGEGIAVHPAALPGRGRRITEPLVPSITDLADSLLEPALRHINGPIALFGHSMGALVAFELAHRAAAAGRPPALLIASGSPAPQSHPSTLRTDELSDAVFLEAVNALGGVPDGLLEVADMRSLLLPILRADYAAAETYRCLQRPLLNVPLLVLGGSSDQLVSPSELDLWRDVTSGPSAIHIFDGGHFYLIDHMDAVLGVLRAAVDSALGHVRL